MAAKQTTDPYAQYAQAPSQSAGDPYAQYAQTDQSTPAQPASPSLLSQGVDVAKNLGIGAMKGAGSTMSSADDFARKHLPAFMTNTGMGFGKPENIPAVKSMMEPQGTAQSIGKGLEQAGEFMIPGGAEKKLLGKAPLLARMAGSALGSGVVNKAQGGDFSTGAAMGAGGNLVGEAAKGLAPKIAESAMDIRKASRAFGKTPGQAILEETRGVRPETIADSAQERMNQLTPELERQVDAASVRPNRIRGLLPAPAQEIPLHTGRFAGETPTSQGTPRDTLFQYRAPIQRGKLIEAARNPENPMEPRSGNPMADISEYPGINPHFLSGSSHPEMSGQYGPSRGVLIRPFEAPTGERPIPATERNPMASLAPARGIVREAVNRAASQNAEGLHGQLSQMGDFLGRRFDTGAGIPENVTPRELLDLKRGFNEEHLRWNPEMHDRALSTGRRAYGALDSELDRTVPEAAGLNQRISSLTPVAQRAESISRNAPIAQRLVGRAAAHTGALTLGGMGAAGGYHEGGVPGAILGGLTGVLAPELVASPEGQMIAARTLFSPATRTAGRAAGGGLLQLNRGGQQ
jgi:hypothetical protein